MVNPINKMTVRYTVVSPVSGSSGLITRYDALNFLVMGFSANSVYRIAGAVHVDKVEMWLSSATTSAQPFSLTWDSVSAPFTIKSDVQMGTNRPAHIISKPPANGAPRWWSVTGSNESDNLFLLNCPTGTVIDVHYSYTLMDPQSQSHVNLATSQTPTFGAVYRTPLNGLFATSIQVENVSSIY
jgi:hypothetical protein